MYTVRKITAEYSDTFPEEINCILAEHLIDSQQELARSIARKHKKTYLRDIDVLETEYFPMHVPFPVNKLVYFRELYRRSPDYRNMIRSTVPSDQMDSNEYLMTITATGARLMSEATWAWNYMTTSKYAVRLVVIDEHYCEVRAYRSRWKRSGWAEGQY